MRRSFKYNRLAARLLMILPVLFAANVSAKIVTVSHDIKTSFATYHPLPVTVTPNARQFTIASDFSNISNFSKFNFTAAQKSLLLKNGFVAIPSSFYEMYDLYLDCENNHIPAFVTADLMLHTLHKQFDNILKTLETEKFSDTLTTMTASLLAWHQAAYAAAKNEPAKTALKNNLAYFAVASTLLGTTPTLPAEVKTLADAELKLINAQAGLAASPIFLGGHDYSQFIVRGHYAGDAVLEKFFRGMMWYGLMRFTLKEGDEPYTDAELRRFALQSLLITQRLHGSASWSSIYQPTNFMVGASSAATPLDLERIATKIYGANYTSLTPDQLADATRLGAFLAQAQQLSATPINKENGVYFSFMGQRSLPDSFILKTTMDVRLPRGLDVMAVLGSPRAESILNSTYHELNSTLTTHLNDLKTTFSAYREATWVQNAYWNWLYCLAPVVEAKGAGYPPFMQRAAWQEKDLAAALGSWAELRHDTILYGEQPSSFGGGEVGKLNQGYVEPNPAAFGRLAALVQYLRAGLIGTGISSDFLDYDTHEYVYDPATHQINLTGHYIGVQPLIDLLLQLKTIAEKELNEQPFTFEDCTLIERIGATIRDLAPLTPPRGSQETDDMAVIADVATNSSDCQEEAVGRPLDLYVIINADGDLHLTRGAAFSYYEFAQPANQRLTDQQWRAKLSSTTPPAMPAWISDYYATATGPTPRHSSDSKNGYSKLEFTCSPNPVWLGQPLTISARIYADASEVDTVRAVLRRTPSPLVAPYTQTVTTVTLTRTSTTPLLYAATIYTYNWKASACGVDCTARKNNKDVFTTREQTFTITLKNAVPALFWRRFE